MSVLPYVIDGEPVNAEETNAALKQVLTDSGLDPDGNFPGFLTEVDLDAATAAVQALIDAEEAARIAADNAEAAARAAADSAEATARAAGDATNATAISNETTARIADVDAEEAARIAAVSAEATARAAADSAESAARIAADALKQDILTRTTVGVTTASLANNIEETGTIALGKLGFIIKAVADQYCRVRLYSTSAARTTDSARAIGTDPSTAAGVLADLVFAVASGLTITCQPLIPYNNNDGTVVTTIYYAIQNRSGASNTVTVTFTRMVLET